MSEKVTDLHPKKLAAGEFDRLIDATLGTVMQTKGFNPAFKSLVLSEVRSSVEPLRKCFEDGAIPINSLLNKCLSQAIVIVLIEIYRRVSIEQQARDHGLDVVPVKDF